MAPVRFAFGAKPEIPEADARDLAEALLRRRNPDAMSALAKIEREAGKRDDDAQEEVSLTRLELQALIAVFWETPDRPDSAAMVRLRREAEQAFSRQEWVD